MSEHVGIEVPSAWMGSLIFESRDASGLYYRRNRYYDSEKGRFTQEDPIGMAGGINLYGFGNGDPVGYSDPYGLSACEIGKQEAPCRSAGGGGTHAMQRYLTPSVNENREYGGEIIETGNGQFMYTSVRGTVDGVDANPNVPGHAGGWHAHGPYDSAYKSEEFSPADMRLGDDTGRPEYLVTPSGRMLKYDNGTVSQIGTATYRGGKVQGEVQIQRERGAM